MTTYNGSASILATATISGNSQVDYQSNASLSGIASASAVGNLLFKESASVSVSTNSESIAVYTLFAQAIEETSVIEAKSLKAIRTGLSNEKMESFVMGGKMYFLDGINFFYYDGVRTQEIVPYIPTLLISKNPGENGGGTLLEDFNLLGTGFKETFSGDGTGKEYYLSLKDLDLTAVTATVDNVVKVENTDFTVDRATGKVTFNTAPTTGTNNVEIVAHKTQTDFSNRIKKCTFSVIYGGQNDTRVFVSGNPEHPNMIWRSGVYDPTYFPENGFYKVGNDNEKIQGFSKQYDYLVIEKQRSKWLMRFELTNGEPSFPLKPINDQIGTFAPKSIQTIENNPVSLDKYGVYMLQASTIRDERNVALISLKVNDKLLREPNLEQAISIDYDKKYYLAINGNVYIYDYSYSEWYIFDNIYVSCFIVLDNTLYFGSSKEGLVYRFKDDKNLYAFTDDGLPIKAHWVSKLFNFSAPEYLKVVQKIFLEVQPNTHSSAKIYARSDRKGDMLILNPRLDKLDFDFFDFNRFSFITSDVPQELVKKVKMKKITHLQIRLENDVPDESLGIIGISIKFNIQNEVR